MLYYHFINKDFLIFRGKERLDLINRLSTNQVDKLHIYQGLKTILTSDKGRVIDILTLFVFDDFVLSACSYSNSSIVKTHLDKYTIMDDFRCEDISGTHKYVLFYGDDVTGFAEKELSFDAGKHSNNDFMIFKLDGFDILAASNDDGFGGIIVVYPAGADDVFKNKFLSNEIAGKYNMQSVNEAKYNIKRIELGIPEIPDDINEDINPLECGLSKYLSFTKGCYIGQEVIARLDTYDKINKHLVGIKFGNQVAIDMRNSKIYDEKNECGYITSTAISGKFGTIGLGYVKTQFLNYETGYHVNRDNEIINCKLSKLPF
ncbi:MAG: YgfZ/GcvT domain-containing protein [Ignavibacteria bacterium]